MSTVDHPAHYNRGKIEVIEAIEDWKLDFHLGNAVKYIARAGIKDPIKEVEDLEKAAWYLARKISLLRKVQPNPADQYDIEAAWVEQSVVADKARAKKKPTGSVAGRKAGKNKKA